MIYVVLKEYSGSSFLEAEEYIMIRPIVLLFCFLSIVLVVSDVHGGSISADKFKRKYLFTEVQSQMDVRSAKKRSDKTVKRKRFVKVNFKDIEGTPEIPKRITLNLFGDKVFIAKFDRLAKRVPRGIGWVGHLEGVARSQVILIIHDGRLTGSISMPGGNFQVRGTGDDIHVIEELDHSQFPEELDPIRLPNFYMRNQLDRGQTAEADGGEGCGDITVLVAYTPEARAAAGGTIQMENLISLAVAETNQSYINSGVNARLTLVHTMETSPGQAANSFSTDLYALRNTYDGIFDSVDAARDTYFADEVALIIENTQYCGLGYLNSTASTAFTVTHRSCATGYYSFGHEIGHNMGARHDWYVDDTSGSQKGFVNVDHSWRTIMSYNSLCSANSTYCSRLQYWSNPNVYYGGDPMGVNAAGPKNCVEGSQSPDPSSCAADNRATLNATCSAVANFRVSSPATPPDLTVNTPNIADEEMEPDILYTINVTAENIGGSVSGATTLAYYQSTNSIISGGDTLLGTQSVPSLAKAAESQHSLDVYAPSEEGTYFVGACVDSVPTETVTSNNCSVGTAIMVISPVVINPPAPDLTVVAAAINRKTANPAEMSALSLTVTNMGNATSQSTVLRYYRSLDNDISALDTLLGIDIVPSLLEKASSDKSITFAAPMREGTYWYGACVDAVADEAGIYSNCSAAVKLTVGDAPFPWSLFSPVGQEE